MGWTIVLALISSGVLSTLITALFQYLQTKKSKADGLESKVDKLTGDIAEITKAQKKAEENLKMIEMPARLPKDGDLSKDSAQMSEDDWVTSTVMGGINGYGISSYTKHKEACIEFVNFATSYDMINRRAEILGIAPARSDVADQAGEVTKTICQSLADGKIYLMPSIKAVDQIWVPAQTLMGDIAKDPFRENKGETPKYDDAAKLQTAVEKMNQEVYDAIFTLAE